MAARATRSLAGAVYTRHLPGIPVGTRRSSNSTPLKARAIVGSPMPPVAAGSSSVRSRAADGDSPKGAPAAPRSRPLLTRRAVLAAGQSTPGTYERYEECLRLHVIPALGKVKLEKLTPQHVDAALTRMEAGVGAYSPTILRAALNKALKWGMVYRNAAALSEPPRPARRKARFLEPDEAERLLEAAEGHKDEAL